MSEPRAGDPRGSANRVPRCGNGAPERSGGGRQSGAARTLTLLLLLALLPALSGRASTSDADRAQEGTLPAEASDVPVDAGDLASGPYATMGMLYERTIFQVDVLRLTLQFGPETAGELEGLVAGREYSGELADSVAAAAVEARNVLVRSRFLRDVDFEAFMDGIRTNMGHARDAGFLSPEEYRTLLPEVESGYEEIRDRGIREGETMWYRVREDRFRVVLQTADGRLLLDRTSTGPEHRRALLGGYLAPESDFREDLIRSLVERGGR